MAYIRTNIYITDRQKEGLFRVAENRDIKFSEAVRQAIKEWIKKYDKVEDKK